MKIHQLLIWTLLFLTLPATAQRRKAPKLTPEQQEQQAKLQRTIDNTQRIMFIDSIVVNKQNFLRHYLLSPEVGRIASYQDFFKSTKQPHAYVCINELGNRMYLSQEATDSTINLYSSETMDNRWTRPAILRGINDDGHFKHVNYPYMMGDGETFYFAADGGDGLGGYDIYVTRYDAEDNQFLRPANIGMPFNSEANDYMYVVDEYSNLGWFATDRNQPEDTVCIYIFQPSQTRQKYSAEGLTTEEIITYARIDRIADTWTDKAARDAALQRLHKLTNPVSQQQPRGSFQFIINDDITYTRLKDFKAPGNAQRYEQLTTLEKKYNRLLSALDRARDYYITASREERNELRPEILASEQKQQELHLEIRNTEKAIRNAEISFLTQNP